MANIYQISQDLLNLFAAIEDNEGELTSELEEQLVVTQESFKDKIKDYVNVIKLIKSDIASIKEEKDRLNNLQKSKESTIKRLEKVIIEAVDMFGNTSKTGSKFIDYGTGKVSIRNSTVVDVDTDSVDNLTNKYINALSWYKYQGILDLQTINTSDLLEYCNSDVEETGYIYTLEDLEDINADISLDISLVDMFTSDKGLALAKALIDYNNFDVKSKVNKTDIKNKAKVENKTPSFAKINTNKTLTIK